MKLLFHGGIKYKLKHQIIKDIIIHKGAEANLLQGYWFDKEVIFKHRIPKNYRIKELDRSIRMQRTLNEARALIKIKTYGINCPQVYDIDISNSIIIMKFIKGTKLRDIIETINHQKKQELFKKIGQEIAILHKNGHIHGDITTSNIIITEQEEIFLIDFGLHNYSDTIEDKSVDLHLFKRVLISSHGNDFNDCFSSFIEGYEFEYKKDDLNEGNAIIKNISNIETRGRYVKKGERR